MRPCTENVNRIENVKLLEQTLRIHVYKKRKKIMFGTQAHQSQKCQTLRAVNPCLPTQSSKRHKRHQDGLNVLEVVFCLPTTCCNEHFPKLIHPAVIAKTWCQVEKWANLVGVVRQLTHSTPPTTFHALEISRTIGRLAFFLSVCTQPPCGGATTWIGAFKTPLDLFCLQELVCDMQQSNRATCNAQEFQRFTRLEHVTHRPSFHSNETCSACFSSQRRMLSTQSVPHTGLICP